jgi:hypothetical protein
LRGEGAENKYLPKTINFTKYMSKVSENVIFSESNSNYAKNISKGLGWG